MGRVTEAIAFINKDKIPDEMETRCIYTHCSRKDLKELRAMYLKNIRGDKNGVA